MSTTSVASTQAISARALLCCAGRTLAAQALAVRARIVLGAPDDGSVRAIGPEEVPNPPGDVPDLLDSG
jgi:hypothetical protein